MLFYSTYDTQKPAKRQAEVERRRSIVKRHVEYFLMQLKPGTHVVSLHAAAVSTCHIADDVTYRYRDHVRHVAPVRQYRESNLGTIIRVADWYGIKHIVTSTDSADAYNPKTISATMGSFARVCVSQTDLTSYLPSLNLPVYGAFLEGENIHKTALKQDAVLLMGSESHGIRADCESLVTDKITIPAYGQAESLNVAMATGIILDNFKRHA